MHFFRGGQTTVLQALLSAEAMSDLQGASVPRSPFLEAWVLFLPKFYGTEVLKEPERQQIHCAR